METRTATRFERVGRHPRLQIAGGFYHVTSRGNAGASIFADDLDRRAFLDRLGRSVSRFDWTCFAYCLMGNHFHLAIETPEANIAQGMHALNRWYAQRFNWRHDRTGHLFGAPYHTELIERESHFLEVSRYVVRNPVRAKLCRRPEDWPWSSYRATVGLAPSLPWLGTAELLEVFGRVAERARDEYRAFVEEGSDRPREDMARDLVPRHGLFGPGSGPGPGTGLV
jgi:putative transposase